MKLYNHPDYDKNYNDFIKWRDLYEGKHSTLIKPEYLWPHPLEVMGTAESGKLLAARQNRTRYLNLNEIIVSLWISLFFREQPLLDKQTTVLFGDSIKNVDGKQNSFNCFIKNIVTPNYLNYGQAYVLVDSFNQSPKSRAEEIKSGFRPILQCLHPLDVVDWEFEQGDPARLGKLNFLRHQFYKVEPRKTATQKPETKLWTHSLELENGQYVVKRWAAHVNDNQQYQQQQQKQDGIEWDDKGIVLVGGDEIPIAFIRSESWMKDVSEEALRAYNLRSNYDNIVHFGCYDTKVATGVNSEDEQALKRMTEYTIIMLKSADAQVTKIAATDPGAYERAYGDAISTTFKVGLNQLRALPQDAATAQSAETIGEDKEAQYNLVSSAIEDLENLTNNIVKLYADFAGVKNFTGSVTFNKEVKEEDINTFVAVWTAFSDLLKRVDGVDIAAVKKVIKKLKLDNEDKLLASAENLQPEQKEPVNIFDNFSGDTKNESL